MLGGIGDAQPRHPRQVLDAALALGEEVQQLQVAAGPNRPEVMDRPTLELVMSTLERLPFAAVGLAALAASQGWGLLNQVALPAALAYSWLGHAGRARGWPR